MAHGWRGRAAGVGAALAVCTGLGGCMSDDKKPIAPISPPPAAKGMTASPPASTKTTPPATDYRTGPGYQPVTTPARPGGTGAATFPGPNRNDFGSIGAPTPPGNYGAGAPLPGTPSTYAPSVAPPTGLTGSHYTPPAGAMAPSGLGPVSGYPVEPAAGTTARPGLSATRPTDPPPVSLDGLPTPPAAPPASVPGHPGLSPLGAGPNYTSPPSPSGPLAPLSPLDGPPRK